MSGEIDIMEARGNGPRYARQFVHRPIVNVDLLTYSLEVQTGFGDL